MILWKLDQINKEIWYDILRLKNKSVPSFDLRKAVHSCEFNQIYWSFILINLIIILLYILYLFYFHLCNFTHPFCFLQVFVLTISSAVTADQAVFLRGLLPQPLTSAALVAPATAPLVTQFTPLSPIPCPQSASPVLSDYRYAYSSSYQDYFSGPVVNSALTALPQALPQALPYSLPYAYSADWFFRNWTLKQTSITILELGLLIIIMNVI